MQVRVRRKSPNALTATRLIQQTSSWSRIKQALGWQPLAFDIEVEGRPAGDLLLLEKTMTDGERFAYVPYGPEFLPFDDRRGAYLAALSTQLRPHLDHRCFAVRWDLPWNSPYAEEPDRYRPDGQWMGPPEPRVRELRMNWGVGQVSLRKAPTDLLPTDTIVIPLGNPSSTLERMKPKTRYNIRLAERKGVRVRAGGHADADLWNHLYALTAQRNGTTPHPPSYFDPLWDSGPSVRFLVAEQRGRPLAAMFLTISSDQATYLYGASSYEDRALMAPYALQWAAIGAAREAGCRHYDLFGTSPNAEPDHPLFGLYQFKRGFGGSLVHRQGAWDFPFDSSAYSQYRAAEMVAPGFHV